MFRVLPGPADARASGRARKSKQRPSPCPPATRLLHRVARLGDLVPRRAGRGRCEGQGTSACEAPRVTARASESGGRRAASGCRARGSRPVVDVELGPRSPGFTRLGQATEQHVGDVGDVAGRIHAPDPSSRQSKVWRPLSPRPAPTGPAGRQLRRRRRPDPVRRRARRAVIQSGPDADEHGDGAVAADAAPTGEAHLGRWRRSGAHRKWAGRRGLEHRVSRAAQGHLAERIAVLACSYGGGGGGGVGGGPGTRITLGFRLGGPARSSRHADGRSAHGGLPALPPVRCACGRRRQRLVETQRAVRVVWRTWSSSAGAGRRRRRRRSRRRPPWSTSRPWPPRSAPPRCAVARQAGTGRDELADDHVLLQAEQGVGLAALIAASVRTRVVSWKDAADSHDSVASEAFVMPMSSGRPEAGLPPSVTTWRFSSSKRPARRARRGAAPRRPSR